ncbi:hypothetical protein [Pleomorphovibrio marinus]|uniref:hypothetical protein n=1 Tax=Pleomorphovibrio marinus TaxID=2164132 RepID=UPI001E65DFE1|nr:hypothetical protein [Pleomorphovibrio marinus]
MKDYIRTEREETVRWDCFSEGPGCGGLAEEPGYFYIYLSNDGVEGGEAFFDDFTVLNLESYIVQQTDYYPYGLIARNFVREGEKETLDLFQEDRA